ncbi:MAG: VWA domain-containing protein [Gammaproteobacteria bacterium]|nr:VWA domain-containing protein [Gammaproteobacteria bacterium]
MRSKSLPSTIVILAILAFVGYDALFSPPPQSPNVANENLLPSDLAPGSAAYGLRVENSWPPVGQAGQEERIAKDLLAVNYYVVLDGSGSMNEMQCSGGRPKIEVARSALEAFSGSLPTNANLGLLVFDRYGLSERVPLAGNNQGEFFAAVKQVQSEGGTPLASAVKLAYQKLSQQGRRQLGYGEYHLVIVTDGLASEGQSPTVMVNRVLHESPVVFHTIGFCIDENHPLNQPARAYYRTAGNPEALAQGLKDVLAEAPEFTVAQFKE